MWECQESKAEGRGNGTARLWYMAGYFSTVPERRSADVDFPNWQIILHSIATLCGKLIIHEEAAAAAGRS
jgi:hypothetical protein